MEDFPPPRTGRVKAQAPVLTERTRKLSLTIIGRVTNKSVQKVWSLIPYFTEHWKSMGRPVGSDLGNGQFQFQFEKEEDLLTVLENRPYHFAKWMLIIQRWEPTVSPTFPSLIPFWIKVQGIPIHLWKEETVQSLGEDMGIFESSEITDFTIRMRVHVNGLLPLIKSSIIEYPNGDEVTATFVYERLEKHCAKCFRLDHEVKDCLVAKHEARARRTQEDSSLASVREADRIDRRPSPSYNSGGFRFSATREPRAEKGINDPGRHGNIRFDARHELDSRRRERASHESSSRRHYKEPPRDWQRSQRNRARSPKSSSSVQTFHYKGYSRRLEERDRHGSHDRDAHLNEARTNRTERCDESTPSRDLMNHAARGNPLQSRQNKSPPMDFDEAIGAVRNVMHQYTQSTDPAESAARKERLRIAEEEGLIARNADQVMRAAAQRNRSDSLAPLPFPPAALPVEEQQSAERIPAALRLGPLSSPQQDVAQVDVVQPALTVPTKRKPGRPPGRRIVQSSPKNPTGTNSRIRKVPQVKPPLARRKSKAEGIKGRSSKKTAATSRPVNGQAESATNSDNQPLRSMLPSSSRRKVDFYNPPPLGP